MIISRNLSPHPVHALSATFCRHCLRPRRTCQERQWEQRSRWWRGRTLPSSRPTHTHTRPRSNDKSVIPMNIANRESTIIIYEHLQNNMGKTCDMLVSMCEGWFWFHVNNYYPIHLWLVAKAEHHLNDDGAELQPDGTYLYQGPNGRMETWSQRCARLRHNEKVAFNRSLRILTAYHKILLDITMIAQFSEYLKYFWLGLIWGCHL